MSFLGMGPFEIIIVLLVAFIFLGPERMADAARTLGKWTGELRRMGAGVRAEMDDLIAEDAPRQPDRRPAPADAHDAETTPAEDGPVAFRGGGARPYRPIPPDPDGPVAFRGGDANADTQTADNTATPRETPTHAPGDNDRNPEESKA